MWYVAFLTMMISAGVGISGGVVAAFASLEKPGVTVVVRQAAGMMVVGLAIAYAAWCVLHIPGVHP